MRKLARQLRSRTQLDVFHILRLRPGPVVADLLRGLDHELRAHLHQRIVQRSGIVVILNQITLLLENPSGIDLLVNHEGRDTRLTFAVDQRPVDGGGAAVLRQQRSVQVEGAQTRHGPDFARQHPEGHHHKEVGLEGSQLGEELRIAQLLRLQHRNAVFHRVALDGALVHLKSAAARLVGHGHHRAHVESGLEQRIKRAAGELRRTHIDDPDAAEILA